MIFKLHRHPPASNLTSTPGQKKVQNRNGEQKGVDPVKKTAMPRKDLSRILHSVVSFHHRFGQIPHLSRYGKACGQPDQRENGF